MLGGRLHWRHWRRTRADQSLHASLDRDSRRIPDVAAAGEWLSPGVRSHPAPAHRRPWLQLNAGDGALVLTAMDPSGAIGASHSVMIRVEDVDAHHHRAVIEGAKMYARAQDHPYGERQYDRCRSAPRSTMDVRTVHRRRHPASWAREAVSRCRRATFEGLMKTIGFIGAGHIGSQVARLAVAQRLRRRPQQLARARDAGRPGRRAGAARARRHAGRSRRRRRTSSSSRSRSEDIARCRSRRWPARSSSTRTTTIRSATDRSRSSTPNRDQLGAAPGAPAPVEGRQGLQPHLRGAARRPTAQPAGTPNRRALVIAGDDAGAKRTVTELLDRFGFDTVDAGPLERELANPARHARLRSAAQRRGASRRSRGGAARQGVAR